MRVSSTRVLSSNDIKGSSDAAFWRLDDPEVKDGPEIDIGLRRRPLGERFLRGPILLSELAPVAQLPGKALALWLLIRYRVDLVKGDWARIPPRDLAELGIGKEAKIEGLRRLEQAGLVQVERPKGYMLRVRLVKRRRKKRET